MDDTDHDDVDLYICMCRHFIRQTFQYNEHFCLTFEDATLLIFKDGRRRHKPRNASGL